MDTSPLNEALASKSYDKIADICDNLILQAILSLFIPALLLSFSLDLRKKKTLMFVRFCSD